MANPTPPIFNSQVANAVNVQNFIAVQSGQLQVTQTSSAITFTCPVGTLRTTMKIYNSGSNDCYLASAANTTTVVAVTSSSVPQPASGTNIVSNCDCIAKGAIYVQDFVAGTLSFAAVCAGTNTTALEMTLGYGN